MEINGSHNTYGLGPLPTTTVCKCDHVVSGRVDGPGTVERVRPTWGGPTNPNPAYYPPMAAPVILQRIPGYAVMRTAIDQAYTVDVRKLSAPRRCW